MGGITRWVSQIINSQFMTIEIVKKIETILKVNLNLNDLDKQN